MAKLRKDGNNRWMCATDLPFDTKRILRVITHKSRGMIETIICGGIKSERGFFSTVSFKDFRKTIQHYEFTRATKKNIEDLHRLALANKKQYLAEAKEYYTEQSEHQKYVSIF